MELHQQRECCSLRLGLYRTPLSSSQRAWQQLPLVTSHPGQTGLSFLCVKRPRAAPVLPHLEPHSTRHQLGGAGASHRVAPHLAPRSAAAPGLSSPQRSTWFSATAVFAQELCSLATKPPPVPRALCNASQERPTAEPCSPSACSPRRRRLDIPMQRNISVPFVKMLVLWAGWAFVFNL